MIAKLIRWSVVNRFLVLLLLHFLGQILKRLQTLALSLFRDFHCA